VLVPACSTCLDAGFHSMHTRSLACEILRADLRTILLQGRGLVSAWLPADGSAFCPCCSGRRLVPFGVC